MANILIERKRRRRRKQSSFESSSLFAGPELRCKMSFVDNGDDDDDLIIVTGDNKHNSNDECEFNTTLTLPNEMKIKSQPRSHLNSNANIMIQNQVVTSQQQQQSESPRLPQLATNCPLQARLYPSFKCDKLSQRRNLAATNSTSNLMGCFQSSAIAKSVSGRGRSSNRLILLLCLFTIAFTSSVSLLSPATNFNLNLIQFVEASNVQMKNIDGNSASINQQQQQTQQPAIANPNVILTSKARYKTLYACEDRQLTIDCDYGSRINLIRANYGRFSVAQCNEQGQLDLSIDCMSPITFRIMQERCQDKQRCSVNATNSIFGDKCPKTRKYLEVHFQCQSDQQQQQHTQQSTSNRLNPHILSSQPSMDATEKVDLRNLTTSQPMQQHPSIIYNPPTVSGASGSPILPPNNPSLMNPLINQNQNRPSRINYPQPASQGSNDADLVANNPTPASSNVLYPQPQPQPQQAMTVMNSEIVNSSFSGSQHNDLMMLRPNDPIVVTLRHIIIDNMSNPRCVLWDSQTNQWTANGATILESNLTHTTCAFDQATSYLLVMDYLNPYQPMQPQPMQQPQQQQQQPPQAQIPIVTQQPLGSPYPDIFKLQPVNLDGSMQQPQQPIIGNVNKINQLSANTTSALIGWLFALFVILAVVTIIFIASNMRSSAGAALKSLGNFSAFSAGNGGKFKNRRNDGNGTLHNKDLLVINNQNGHQFLYAPASTTKISGSSSSTHILSPGNGGQGTLHHLNHHQQQQQIYSGNGTLSNLSGTGAQSNNYYYGPMTNMFQQHQQQQQQQQQHHLSQHHLNQQTMSSYHHQANKSTISTESANSTPSSSGVESGSTGIQQQQQQQQQQGSCLIMSNDYNLMGSQSHYQTNGQQQQQQLQLNQPTLTLNAHYSSSVGPLMNNGSNQQQQQQQQHRLVGLVDGSVGGQTREHIYECVDDDKPAYAARLLMPMNLVKSPLDPFNSNTLSQQQHLHQQQQQQQQQRAMTLSSRLLQNNAFQQHHQQQQQQQMQQANGTNTSKRLFSHPAIVRDNQVQAKTSIICSKMAQVAPQRATEISGQNGGVGGKFQHEVMAIFNDNHNTTTSSTAAIGPLFQQNTCFDLSNAASKLGTDC